MTPRPNGWPRDFSAVFADRTTAEFTAHPLFKPAKRGDYAAAEKLVADLVDDWTVRRMTACLRPNCIAVERRGQGNQVPAAFAARLAHDLEIPVLTLNKIGAAGASGRHAKTAIERMIQRPSYRLAEDTELPEDAGWLRIVIVDDITTTGGTLQEMRVALNRVGLWTVGMASVAYTPSRDYSNGLHLWPSRHQLTSLLAQHPALPAWLAHHAIYDGEPNALTLSEVRALARCRQLPPI